MTREKLLKKTQESLQEEELQFTLQQDKLQLQADLLADLLETNRQLELAKRRLVVLKSSPKLSSPDIIKQKNEIAGLAAGAEELEALMEELFPSGKGSTVV